MQPMIGKVLWFDVKKGYGFIRTDNGAMDVFVHYSKISAAPGEFRVLEEGERVEFEVFYADRGAGRSKPQAREVQSLGDNMQVTEDLTRALEPLRR
jgi:cold shock protein